MKFSTASSIIVVALATPAIVAGDVRAFTGVYDCTGLAQGYQQCSDDAKTIVTCNHGTALLGPVAPGTKCCDDDDNDGKVFATFADQLCYSPDVDDCAGLAQGYQQCSDDATTIITCNHGTALQGPVAPGTKCCDDELNVGKVFMTFADQLCYSPCGGSAVVGDQLCIDGDSTSYITCTNGASGSLVPTLQPLPAGTSCCSVGNKITPCY